MTQFTINKEINIKDIGASGSGRVTAKVTGYWSRDSITVYINRGYYGSFEWSFTLTHSSGGRDTKEVESDLEAAKNFGAAMIAMAEYAEELKALAPQLEQYYQAQRAIERAEEAAIKQAEQEKFDADTPVGTAMAEEMMAKLLEQRNDGYIVAYKRGQSRGRSIQISKIRRAVYFLEGRSVSKQDAIKALAESSARSYLNVVL